MVSQKKVYARSHYLDFFQNNLLKSFSNITFGKPQFPMGISCNATDL